MKKLTLVLLTIVALTGCKIGQINLPRFSIPVATSAADYQAKLGCTDAIAYCGTVHFVLNTSAGAKEQQTATFYTDTDSGLRWMLYPDGVGGLFPWRMEGIVNTSVSPARIDGLVLEHADIDFWMQQVTTVEYTRADWDADVPMICQNWVMTWVPNTPPHTGVNITADCARSAL